MLKRNKIGVKRTVELEVAGERIRAATWPLNPEQNTALVVLGLAAEELKRQGVWDDEMEADAVAGEDAEALAALWGERLPLREELQKIRLVVLHSFLLERHDSNGKRLPCDEATLCALPTKQRHALAMAILQDMETKRAIRAA